MTSKGPANSNSRRAFTLLELLLVLMLIGISAATLVPHLNGTLGRWQLRETARNLQAALQLASQWACVRQESVVFDLNAENGAFALRPLESRRSGNSLQLPVGWQSFGQGVEIADMQGFDGSGQERALTFRPDGRSPAATIVLTGARRDANRETVWQITLDGHGVVQCQEKPTDEVER